MYGNQLGELTFRLWVRVKGLKIDSQMVPGSLEGVSMSNLGLFIPLGSAIKVKYIVLAQDHDKMTQPRLQYLTIAESNMLIIIIKLFTLHWLCVC